MADPADHNNPQLDRLKRWTILLLVVLQAVTVIAILFFSSLASESALLTQAQKILNGATSETIAQTEAFLDDAYHEASLAAELFSTGVLNMSDTDRLERYFLSQLAHNESFAGLYIGTSAGEFFYVSRDPQRQQFRTKHIHTDGGVSKTDLRWRDNVHAEPTATEEAPGQFDPRTRPWFREANAANGFVWTDPYIFFTSQRLGITAARPLFDANGTRLGVIGVDLELKDLAGFLAALDIGESGSAFITNSDGLLIATPTIIERTDSLASLSISAMADPIGRQVLESIRTASRRMTKSSSASFTVGKTRYIADAMPMRLSDGEQWLVGTYAARSDFLKDVRSTERNNLYVAIGILLVALLIGALLANSAWTPLELLHSQANRDQLTRAWNRHYLMKNGRRLFEEARRSGEPLSVAIVDLDHFKQINDTLGHAAGDAVIKDVARRLQRISRSHDIVARFGGEEFVLLLPTACAAIADTVLQRARDDLKSSPVEFDSRLIEVGFSAGICEIGPGLDQLEPVLSAADAALYRAKHRGRDQTAIHQHPGTPEEDCPEPAMATARA